MPPIRTSYRNIGGPFPGGSAPSMTKDFHLKDGRAGFERFNDAAANRSVEANRWWIVASGFNEVLED